MHPLDFLGDILFGSAERGGIAEAAMRAFAHFFKSGAADSLGGAASSGAAETGFARAAGWFSNATDALWQYQIWSDSGGQGGETGWKNVSEAERHKIELVTDAAKSHSFILQQARAGKIDSHYLEQYEKLGLELPSEELLKQMHRRLRSVLHEDKGEVDRALFQDLTDAVKKLQNPEIIEAYNEMRLQKPKELEAIFRKMTNIDMRAVYEQAEKAARLKLGYNGVTPQLSKAEKWVADLSGKQKVGLAFGVITGVALVAYGTAKVMDSRRTKKQEQNAQQPYTARVLEKNPNEARTVAV